MNGSRFLLLSKPSNRTSLYINRHIAGIIAVKFDNDQYIHNVILCPVHYKNFNKKIIFVK